MAQVTNAIRIPAGRPLLGIDVRFVRVSVRIRADVRPQIALNARVRFLCSRGHPRYIMIMMGLPCECYDTLLGSHAGTALVRRCRTIRYGLDSDLPHIRVGR